MSSIQHMKDFISERLTAAAEEIFAEFEKTIVQYEEELDGQRRLLMGIFRKPQIIQPSKDLPQQHLWKEVGEEEEVAEEFSEPQCCDQKTNSRQGQEEPEAGQIKQEPEELSASQESEPDQLVLKQWTDTFMVHPVKDQPEPITEHILPQNFPAASHQEARRGEDLLFIRELQKIKKGQKTRDPSRVKMFSCHICGKSFIYRNSLTSHIRSHTGEKPFPCNMCEKSFCCRSNLARHIKLHTGERPFTCLTCGKDFNRAHHLKLHMSTHTNEKAYVCVTCGETFSRKTLLSAHLRMHAAENRELSCTAPLPPRPGDTPESGTNR